MLTKLAVKILSNALKKDRGYWDSWKSNIAVQFQDSYKRADSIHNIHTISNEAAENFLRLLTR